ncbi:hypothetical protein E2C01_079629 [Portunus trituberculatus]|uniref:Uncharacterized protein n=1 Tax=Portunus trituberculatus TaxID=210409 RepID=A0A5B7IW44_PORTR|nr:hypothetical protein [Portunus trituberculatus]
MGQPPLVDTTTNFTAVGVTLKSFLPCQTYKYLGLKIGPSKDCAEPGLALASIIQSLGRLHAFQTPAKSLATAKCPDCLAPVPMGAGTLQERSPTQYYVTLRVGT